MFAGQNSYFHPFFVLVQTNRTRIVFVAFGVLFGWYFFKLGFWEAVFADLVTMKSQFGELEATEIKQKPNHKQAKNNVRICKQR